MDPALPTLAHARCTAPEPRPAPTPALRIHTYMYRYNDIVDNVNDMTMSLTICNVNPEHHAGVLDINTKSCTII